MPYINIFTLSITIVIAVAFSIAAEIDINKTNKRLKNIQ